MGLENVRTYIQSGNVVFQTSPRLRSETALVRKIEKSVLENHNFEPKVILLTLDQVQRISNENPLCDNLKDPGKLHCFFWMKTPTNVDHRGIEKVRAKTEKVAISDHACYVHAPDGVASSKLFPKLEKLLGVESTARNLKTVAKLIEIAEVL